MNREEQVRILIDYLKKENTGYASLADPVDYTGRRRLLRSLMNVRWPGEADPEYTRIQDELLKEEAEQKGIVEWGQLPTIGGQFPCETIKNVDKISLAGRYYKTFRRCDRKCGEQPDAWMFCAVSWMHRQCDPFGSRYPAS